MLLSSGCVIAGPNGARLRYRVMHVHYILQTMPLYQSTYWSHTSICIGCGTACFIFYFSLLNKLCSTARSTIREKIIPHAVSWFTGEAQDEEYDEENYSDDDEYDEEDEEDE